MARGAEGEVRALTYRWVTCSQRAAPSNTWVLHLQTNQSVKQTNRQINKWQKQELLRGLGARSEFQVPTPPLPMISARLAFQTTTTTKKHNTSLSPGSHY